MRVFSKSGKVAILLALLVSLGACSNHAENDESNSKNQVKQQENNSNEVPTLVYYNVGPPQADTDEVAESINQYLDNKDAGYHISFQYFDWGDYQQKLQLASNAGDDWDIAFTASWAGPYKNMAENGAFLDITDLIKEDGKAILDSASDEVIKGASINGRLYGVPATAENIVPADYFIWNKEYVDKYNIPIDDIKTEADLEPYLKEVKEKEANVEYPFVVLSDYIFQTENPQSEATPGVAVKNENGKLIAYNKWASQEVKDLAFTMKDYMDKGYIDPSAPQLEAANAQSGDTFLVAKGEGGVNPDNIWSRSYDTEVVSSFAEDKALVTNEKATGSLAAINSQSEHAKESMDFLNRMYSDPELMRYLVYGIEGKHYNLVDDKVDIIEDSGYEVPGFTFLASEMMTPTVDANTDEKDKKQMLDTYLDRVEASPILGFNFDKTGNEKEAENVEEVIEQYERDIKTGAFSEEYYQEFLEKLDIADIDKLVKDVQEQLDKWEDK